MAGCRFRQGFSAALRFSDGDRGRGLLDLAVSSGRPSRRPRRRRRRLQTCPQQRAGLAVPITVGGRSVAVLYADDAPALEPRRRRRGPRRCRCWLPTPRHAWRRSRRLARRRPCSRCRRPAARRCRGQRRSPEEEDSSARRYARLLVSEIKLYNESAVRTGRREAGPAHIAWLRRSSAPAGCTKSASRRRLARARPTSSRNSCTRSLTAIRHCSGIGMMAPEARLRAPSSCAGVARARVARRAAGQLAPTAHPPLPATASDMWLVPAETPATDARLLALSAARRRGGRYRGRQLRQRADARQPPGARRPARWPTTRSTTRASPSCGLNRAADARDDVRGAAGTETRGLSVGLGCARRQPRLRPPWRSRQGR